MCGLVGMAGFLEYKHRLAMKDLLFLDTLRGRDSTGLGVVSRDRQVLIRKMTVPGSEFIEYPVVEKSMSYGDQVWIGHNRFKTTGDVSKANAHPFEIVDVDDTVILLGAHNGTLSNKWSIEQKLKGEKYETDSEALFNYLVEAPNYKEAVNNFKGAWSLVWWDATADALYFCRNQERPLIYAYTKDKKVLIWASEAWMLLAAARRNGIELEENKNGYSCYSTLPDHLYCLKIPQAKDTPLPALTREGGYVGEPTPTFRKDGWKSWQDKYDNESEEEEEQAKKRAKESSTDREKIPPKNHITLGGIRGFGGELISLAEFKDVQDKGCAWCKGPVKDGEIFAFLNETNLVCHHCMRDTHEKGADLLNDDPFDADDSYPSLVEELLG